MYYGKNPITCGSKQYTRTGWATSMVTSILNFTLRLWNERWDALHGATEEEVKNMIREKVVTRVTELYQRKETVTEDAKYLFEYDMEIQCSHSTQYLTNWMSTLELYETEVGQGLASQSLG